MAAMKLRRSAGLALLVAGAMLVPAGRVVYALSPTVMMFYGAPLARPVFVTGADTLAFGDMVRKSPVSPAELGPRPFIKVALFWGPAHDPALNGTRALDALKPEMAWQHGRFYPSSNSAPAVLLVTPLDKQTKVRAAQAAATSLTPVPADPAVYVWGGPTPAIPAALLERVSGSK